MNSVGPETRSVTMSFFQLLVYLIMYYLSDDPYLRHFFYLDQSTSYPLSLTKKSKGSTCPLGKAPSL